MFEGLYIHIPFCGKKCPYCDFFSVVGETDYWGYLTALLEEIKLYSEKEFQIKTIYFGGGTPSTIPPKLYEKFFSLLGKLIDLSQVEEITIEVNPEDYRFSEFSALRKIGFNRISVGVQSFLPKNLKILGRKHSVRDSLETVEAANKAGFENISVDLIWGLPQQTPKDLIKEFEILKTLPVVHLSAYTFTVYEETPLKLMVESGRFILPSEEEIETLYYTLLEQTQKLNFKRYEISNFAKSERFFSKHNLLYWKMKPFLGIGAGAWSFDGKRRWYNLRSVKGYKEALFRGKKPIASLYGLNGEEYLKEAIITGLRTTEGIPLEWIKDKIPKEVLEEFFIQKGEKVAFNDKGFLVSNAILSMLV